MTTFLTAEEIVELTGRVQPAAQRRWLSKGGYRFDVRADGRPALLRAQVEKHQRCEAPRTAGPDLAALDAVG